MTGWWILTRSATPSIALLHRQIHRQKSVPVSNPQLPPDFEGKQSAWQKGISSRFNEVGRCTSRQNSGVADYSRQIVHTKTALAVNESSDVEIVLLHRSQQTEMWDVSDTPDIDLQNVFTKYDRPNVWDVLKFGALYPDEQRKAPLIFPHEPWNGPHGPTFVLVLQTDRAGKRGLSYITHSGNSLGSWLSLPLVAVRRRRGVVT